MIYAITSSAIARTSVLIGIFAVVALAIILGYMTFSRWAFVRGELQAIAGTDDLIPRETLADRRQDVWSRLVARIEKAGLSLTDSKGDIHRRQLRAAGYDSPAAPRIYTLIRLVGVIALPSLFVLLSLGAGRHLTFTNLYIMGSFWALAGLYLPTCIVRIQADRRRTEIINGFPDCLDLMLVCVEAGLGIEAALDRVAREMSISHPLVSYLLTLTTLRLRAGAARDEALRLLAQDAEVDEITSFVTLLIQSDKLGTSIATTLRIYASEMRERRRMRAEEKAHRIPVLISIPLVTCLLPTMIGVLMLPAVIMTMRKVIPAMLGG